MFSALVTFYIKFPRYFSNLDFHVTNKMLRKIIDSNSFKILKKTSNMEFISVKL